jgi:hypothetical protein
VALTPVFLLSGIKSLFRVLSIRLARVADRVDALAEQLEADGALDRRNQSPASINLKGFSDSLSSPLGMTAT